ncbi:MAG TPA: serine hydrolase domain-containing protein [Bryobacteraceae bacterium]|nr:serine hydrolase domain-containing protein [Bryobacteraceae bacterium]
MPHDFTIPQGWTLEGTSTLVGPEGDLRITFVELEPAATIVETALAGWRQIDPGFGSKVLREAALPPMDGWDELHQVLYEVPAKEARMELAIVRRLGSRAFVNLVRGSTAAISRRGAQLSEAFSGWKPQGYREVSLQDRAASLWTDEQCQKFKEFIVPAMAAMQIPGVSIAVVQNGRIVWSDGFGVRRAGEQAPVHAETRFMIGSATKPLTTLLMAMLIDQQKLSWATRVCDLLPGFALADPEMSGLLTVKHTASASTGMPRQDAEFVFRYSKITPEERIAEMKSMRPTTGFGETFQYSNFLVAAGGYAAARAFTSSGSLEAAYESAFTELVRRPLGMRDTFLRQEDAQNGDAAMPHALNFEGGVSPLPLHIERAVYSVAPAGGAWSTALDLARYVLLELGNGKMPEGERVVSEEVLLERRAKGIKIDEKSCYGLGLFISDESGLRVIHHGGNTFGFSTDMFFVPERGLGVVVLTNLYAANLFLVAVRQKIFELAFGAEPKAEKTIAAAAKMIQDGVAVLRQKTSTDPSALEWIADLIGTYHCAELGSATIERRGDGFWVQFDEWGSALGCEIQASGDRLLRLLAPPWRGSMKLLVDPEGKTLLLDQAQQKYVFSKQ